MRAVIDTNVLLSAFIKRHSSAGRVLEYARRGRLKPLYSATMLDELLDVFGRPHIQRRYHISADDMEALFVLLQAVGEPVIVQMPVQDCRDPKDNKFLEVALAGRADYIISGDDDLHALHPWRGIEIWSPAQAAARLDSTGMG